MLTFYRLPAQHHEHVKSTDMLERLNEEIQRRTHVVRIFSERGELPAGWSPSRRGDARELDRGHSLPEYGTAQRAQKNASARRCLARIRAMEGMENASRFPTSPTAPAVTNKASELKRDTESLQNLTHTIQRATRDDRTADVEKAAALVAHTGFEPVLPP